ncbi:MAG: ATP-binding cassette domain-containing protein [Actinophytocola sp.]|nr:ATP-binding cassette domain-containing protein [Actinophytocola sp.]
MDTEVQLSLSGICKQFRQTTGRKRGRGGSAPRPDAPPVPVLADVNFEVREQEFVAVIGPSGCGKTTLIKIIHGLLPAEHGVVELNGKPVTNPSTACGFVFQHAGLLPWRTAQKNVEFGLETKGVARAERARVAEEALTLVGLTGFEDYYPHQLSGGMQQRVGLARALARGPDVLLMDEPFGALDAQTRERMQEELLKINELTKKTVVFVTHDLDEAVYLADRVVVLAARPGRVREIVDINLPRPRPPAADTKSMAEFVDKRRLIWSLINTPADPVDAADPVDPVDSVSGVRA